MASITIRNLPDSVKERLRVRAAQRGKALEADVREMLIQYAIAPPPQLGEETATLIWPAEGFPVPYLSSGAAPKRADTSRDTLYD